MLRDTDARRQGAGDAHSAELGKLLGPGAGDLELIHLLRSQTPLQHRKASLSACRARTRATKDGQRPAPRQCARWRPLRFRIDLAALDEVDATVRFDPAHDDQRDMRFKPAPLPTTAPGPTRPLAPSPMCAPARAVRRKRSSAGDTAGRAQRSATTSTRGSCSSSAAKAAQGSPGVVLRDREAEARHAPRRRRRAAAPMRSIRKRSAGSPAHRRVLLRLQMEGSASRPAGFRDSPNSRVCRRVGRLRFLRKARVRSAGSVLILYPRV